MKKKILVVGYGSSGALAAIQRIKSSFKEGELMIVHSAEKLASASENAGQALSELSITFNDLKKTDLPKPKSKYHK